MPGELLANLDLGSARGGKKREAEPLQVSVVRELCEADLPGLVNPPPVAAQPQTISKLRHSHHQLARLMAQGMEVTAASYATGYSIAYISTISNNDPAFRELLAYYATEREAVFADTVERMRSLGLETLDELRERLQDDPGAWSNRELMEMAELMLVKPQRQPSGQFGGGQSQAPSGVTVNVKFVQGASAGEGASPLAPSIDLEASDVEFESE